MGTRSLQREIEGLETRLDPAASRTIDELSRIRRDLSEGGEREPVIELPNLRLGFKCKQRWEDMVGDDRVRACGGCDRPVFNLSAMTRDEAERLLATRGLTPCVRFYRRPDGTVMTTDCPTGVGRGRRLAVVASSLAAGSALVAPSVASADPDPQVASPDPVPPSDATAPDPAQTTPDAPVTLDTTETMGIPVEHEALMGEIIMLPEPRPRIEWSVWGRLGLGVAKQHANVLARSLTPPALETASLVEAALSADVSVGVANNGNIRLGAFAELRTTSGPVVGGELVVEGLPPHPLSSRIDGNHSVVLRAGANAHVITAAVGFGYTGSWPRFDPWIKWLDHVVGARLVTSVNRSIDDPREWSATVGLEVEPLGVAHAVYDLVTD